MTTRCRPGSLCLGPRGGLDGGDMVEEHNRALVCRAVEAIWNRGELDVADVLFAPDYVNHDGLIIDLVRGPEAVKLSVTLYRSAFPHFQITIEDLHAERDTVTLRW